MFKKRKWYDHAYFYFIFWNVGRKKLLSYISWRAFNGLLFIFLLHRLYLLTYLWYTLFPTLSYKKARLMRNAYHTAWKIILLFFLFVFSFNCFVFYARLCPNGHCQHQPHRAHFLRRAVKHSAFWNTFQFRWPFVEEPFRTVCNSGSSSGDRSLGEYRGQSFAK